MLFFKNAELHVGNGKVFPRGSLQVEAGKITAVGENLAPPTGVEVVDLEGKVLTPGFIDAHTHIGIGEAGVGWEGQDYNEMVDPITPHLRAIDGIYPQDTSFKEARSHGITGVMIAPGSANILGGETAVLKTAGRTVEEMLMLQPGGLKAALGENPKRVYGQMRKPERSPKTRMGSAALLRQALVEAQEYLDKHNRSEGEKPARDLKLETVGKVLKREMPLKMHAHRADDIVTAIRIAREFSINMTLEHCTEGHKIADILKDCGFPAIIGPTLGVSPKIETRDKTWATPKILHEAGVTFAIMTDHPVTPIEYLPLCVGLAIKAGLPQEEGLKAVTLNAAQILGVGDRIGSLEAGKDADFVVWDGSPFALETNAVSVYINGRKVEE